MEIAVITCNYTYLGVLRDFCFRNYKLYLLWAKARDRGSDLQKGIRTVIKVSQGLTFQRFLKDS